MDSRFLHNFAKDKKLSELLERGVKNIIFGNPTVIYIKGGGRVECDYNAEPECGNCHSVSCNVWYVDPKGKKSNVIADVR